MPTADLPTTPNEPLAPEPQKPTSSTDQPLWGTAPSAATPPGARFFDAVRRLGIVRPDDGRGVAGVARGIGQRYGVDPVVVRIVFAVLTLLGGLGVALYGLAWLFLPHPDGRIHAQQVLDGTVTAGFVGALLAVLAGAHEALPLLVIALVVFLIVRHHRSSQIRTT